jgi:hypothetical protein
MSRFSLANHSSISRWIWLAYGRGRGAQRQRAAVSSASGQSEALFHAALIAACANAGQSRGNAFIALHKNEATAGTGGGGECCWLCRSLTA